MLSNKLNIPRSTYMHTHTQYHTTKILLCCFLFPFILLNENVVQVFPLFHFISRYIVCEFVSKILFSSYFAQKYIFHFLFSTKSFCYQTKPVCVILLQHRHRWTYGKKCFCALQHSAAAAAAATVQPYNNCINCLRDVLVAFFALIFWYHFNFALSICSSQSYTVLEHGKRLPECSDVLSNWVYW